MGLSLTRACQSASASAAETCPSDKTTRTREASTRGDARFNLSRAQCFEYGASFGTSRPGLPPEGGGGWGDLHRARAMKAGSRWRAFVWAGLLVLLLVLLSSPSSAAAEVLSTMRSNSKKKIVRKVLDACWHHEQSMSVQRIIFNVKIMKPPYSSAGLPQGIAASINQMEANADVRQLRLYNDIIQIMLRARMSNVRILRIHLSKTRSVRRTLMDANNWGNTTVLRSDVQPWLLPLRLQPRLLRRLPQRK